jgi:GNAT superfamily N-acetyltransferase
MIRPWNPDQDTRPLQELASRLWPADPHPGGLGWEIATDQAPAKIVVAEDAGGIVGWAGAGGEELRLHVDPGWPDAAEALAAWLAENADAGAKLGVHEALAAAAQRAGFTPTGDNFVGMFRAAGGPGPTPPPGYRVRHVHDGEDAERVAAHRSAWRPITLPWPDGVPEGVTEDSTSRLTLEMYARVKDTWLYDQELDLVVEAPDGALAACCHVWFDASTGCAEIEPVGVVPEHRRKGLASAMCLEAAVRVAERGGDMLFINVGPRPDYPAPALTYMSIGFEPRTRAPFYRLGPPPAE